MMKLSNQAIGALMMALQKRVISTLDKLSKQNMTGFKLLGKK